jgi:arginyl-tRNA synthetase
MKTVKDQMEYYRAEIDSQLETVAREKEREKLLREYVNYGQYPLSRLKAEFASSLITLGMNVRNIKKIKAEIPPNHVDFDVAFPIFEYCKAVRKSPAVLASNIARYLNANKDLSLIDSAIAQEGYVNILLKRDVFYRELIGSVRGLNSHYGESDVFKDKVAFMDYSSPNIAKPLGVGHLRSTVIGESLSRIYHAVGYTLIKDNHLGDWGTQFGSLIYAYQKWGDEKTIEADPVEELKNLYTRFTAEAENDPILKEEAKGLFARLEKGDPDLLELWNKFKTLSIEAFKEVYSELNIQFDIMIGESFYTHGSNELINDLKKKGIAHSTEDGAVALDGLENIPSFLVAKNDGSTLYVLRDMLAAIHRIKIFKPDVVLYVVGSEQELNFRQLFAVLRAADYARNVEFRHIGFGMVLIDGKKMSTRKGTAVGLNEVIDQLTAKAKETLLERQERNDVAINEIARKIALGAIIYNDLRQNRMSSVDFDWKRMLNLDSGSVVYLEYTYARILSILKKAGSITTTPLLTETIFKDPLEFRLAKKIAFYPEVLLRANENDAPHLVCEFLEELSADINTFYGKVSVLGTDDDVLKKSRIVLLNALSICIKNAFAILNIPILEKI